MWKPEGTPKLVEGVAVQYLRHGHNHEGAHRILHDDGVIDVYPDGVNGTRARMVAMRAALSLCSIEAVVGYLVLNGVTNLAVDGVPLFDSSGAGRWRIDLAETGEVRATWIGG